MRNLATTSLLLFLAPTAAFSVPEAATRLIWIDMDGDGIEDLIRYEPGAAAHYLVNLGDGEFEPAPEFSVVPGGVEFAVAADMDGDQRPELILGSRRETLVVRYGEAGPELLSRIPVGGSVEIRDVDVDGRQDLVVGDQIHLQDGSGSLVELVLPESPTASEGAVEWTDSRDAASRAKTELGATDPPGTDAWLKEVHRAVPAPDGIVYLDNSSSGHALITENSGTGTALEVRHTGTEGSALSVSGQTDADGDLHVTGALGVGTSAPRTSLEIQGTGIRMGELGGDTNNWGDVRFNDEGRGGLTLNSWNNGDGHLADMSFQTNGTTRMFLESAGNVGLGTTSPYHLLDLGDTQGRKLAMYQTRGAENFYGFGISFHSLEFHAASESTEPPGMVLRSEGRVGIGTTDPASTLEVQGTGVRVSAPVPYDDNHGLISFEDVGGGGLTLNSHTGGTWADMTFKTNGAERMVLTSFGQLGINATQADIPSDAMLAVGGKVYCEEVEVMLSSDWPDYVFETDYCLPSLGAVEAAIERQGHLPGVPSADEVAEEGLALGEMQSVLLRKVEEMTLYLIDMNHRMEDLQAQNDDLRERLLASGVDVFASVANSSGSER